MIEAGGRLSQLLGMPRITGQIYGLLYFSTDPLSLDAIVELLGISKASASNGTRQLASWGAVHQVWIQGNRKDYFEVVADVNTIVRGIFNDQFKPRMESSKSRLKKLNETLNDDLKVGSLKEEEFRTLQERVKNLAKLQSRLERLVPIAQKLI